MNGQEALEQVQNREEKKLKPYFFIFLDLHMPILDGFQVKFHQSFQFNHKSIHLIDCK